MKLLVPALVLGSVAFVARAYVGMERGAGEARPAPEAGHASSCCTAGLDRASALGARAAEHAPPAGSYVEARTASVFAGACHYGSEYTTQGRRAVIAWSVESGAEAGVSLAGARAVAIVTCEDNLAEAGAARRSTLFVERGLDDAVRAALVAWLEREHGAALGEIDAVEPAAITFEADGERFAVAAGELVELSGRSLPDRACCSMPSLVCYEPLTPVRERIVGQVEAVRVAAGPGGPWSRADENSAFVARFGPAPVDG